MDNLSDELVNSIAYRRWGISPKRTGKEWHSACPQCGGTDRFMIFGNGGFYCRQCQMKGWLNDDEPRHKIDPLLLIQQAERIAAEKKTQEERDNAWADGFNAGWYWRQWHTAMSEANWEWWFSQGISEHAVRFYELGYLPSKTIRTAEGILNLPAYTIPVYDPDTWNVVNVHYRLANPPSGIGKYRYEQDVSAREFYAQPCMGNDAVIVHEGAKKAIVVCDFLDAAIQVIGLPGCSPSQVILERIAKRYRRVWVGLDPGCEKQAQRVKQFIPQARVMMFSQKPDDQILAGMTVYEYKNLMQQAR